MSDPQCFSRFVTTVLERPNAYSPERVPLLVTIFLTHVMASPWVTPPDPEFERLFAFFISKPVTYRGATATLVRFAHDYSRMTRERMVKQTQARVANKRWICTVAQTIQQIAENAYAISPTDEMGQAVSTARIHVAEAERELAVADAMLTEAEKLLEFVDEHDLYWDMEGCSL